MSAPAPQTIYSAFREDLYIKGAKVAADILEKLEAQPEYGNAEYWEIQAYCHTHLEHFERAARAAETAFRFTKSGPYFVLWAQCLLATDKFEQGQKMLEGFVAAKAPLEDVYESLALSYIAHDEYDEALRVLSVGLDIGELITHYGVYRLLESIALDKTGKEAEAKTSVEKAINHLLSGALEEILPEHFEGASVRMMAFWIVRHNPSLFRDYLRKAEQWWPTSTSTQKESKLDPRILEMRKRALAASGGARVVAEFTPEAMAGTVELYNEMGPYRAAVNNKAF